MAPIGTHGQRQLQTALLSVKPAGAGFDPVCEPLKPIPTDAPGAITAFHDRFVADTFALPEGCDHDALQPSVTR